MEKHQDNEMIEEIELVFDDPMMLFQRWFQAAKDNKENIFPETMALATVRRDGGPSVRNVLLRGLDERGFKMYWDYRSRKSDEIDADGRVSVVFCWSFRDKEDNLGAKQVRVEGTVEKVSEEESTDYFNNEPLASKIRAVVCNQSQVILDNREDLIQRCLEMHEKVSKEGYTLTKPTHWGGYRLLPDMMEFYQGKMPTINDRVRFRKADFDSTPGVHQGSNGWIYERLEP